jgi:curved DNA-binding protein
MDYRDYYQTLGVSKTASQEDIRSAYRKLAMKYHPDRNPGDKKAEEKFKEMNEAYQVLSDPQKRSRYDQLGDSYYRYQQGGGAPGGFDWSQWSASPPGGSRVEFSGDINDLFSDFFRTIFGGAPGAAAGRRARATSSRARPAPAYESPVTISLEEAYSGAMRQVESDRQNKKIRIPPGVRTGSKVRLPGGAPDGSDLYLDVTVADNVQFKREGNDLHSQVTVDVFTALLGGEVDVPTLSGIVHLKIPAGTQPEQAFRIAGRGMPQSKNPQSKGDLYVKIKVNIPRNLTSEQKALLEEAARKSKKG